MIEMGGALGTYFESRDSEKNEKFTPEDLRYLKVAIALALGSDEHTRCKMSGRSSIIFALSYLNDIAIRITHVAANLGTEVLWLSKELCALFSPLLIIPLDVCDTNIDEVTGLI